MLTATVQPYPVTSALPPPHGGQAALVPAPVPGPLIEGHGFNTLPHTK